MGNATQGIGIDEGMLCYENPYRLRHQLEQQLLRYSKHREPSSRGHHASVQDPTRDPSFPDGQEKDRVMKCYRYSGLDTFISFGEPNETVVEFDTDGGDRLGAPRSIDNLWSAVYEALYRHTEDNYDFVAGQIDVMEELESHSAEIAESTVKVYWRCGDKNWGEFDEDSVSESFTFDRKTGESTFRES